MTALTPHIQALRAEAKALTEEAKLALEAAMFAVAKENGSAAIIESTAATLLTRLSTAKLVAADTLEAGEPKLREDDSTVTYNPKGKATRA